MALGFSAQELHSLLEEIRDTNALSSAGCPPHLALLISESHQDAWFSSEGLEKVCRSKRGSLPGDPLGDVIFNLIMASILRGIRTEMVSEGLGWVQSAPSSASFFGTQHDNLPNHSPNLVRIDDGSYVDDGAFFCIARTPQEWLDKFHRSATIIISCFRKRALRVNFKKGKTEVAIALRGKGAQLLKGVIEENGNVITITLDNGETVDVNSVPYYGHMGGQAAPNNKMSFESRRRVLVTNTANRPLRKKIFANPDIRQDTRTFLAEALMCTKLFYNSQIWTALSSSDSRHISACMVGVFKPVATNALRYDYSLWPDKLVLKTLQRPH